MTDEFEKLLISALLKDKQFLKETIGYIDDEIFKNQYYKYFYSILETYYNKYNNVIPFDIFKYLLSKTLTKQNFSNEEFPIISGLIIDIFDTKYDIKFLKSEIGNHIKERKLRKILSSASQNFNLNKIEKLLEDLKDANKYDPEEDKPLEYVSSLHKRSLGQKPVPTSITSLDTIIGGGITPGEFGLISAQTGGCKSMTLLNFAWGAVHLGFRVLFITLEDSMDTVMQRFDALFSNQEFITFRRDPTASQRIKNKVLEHKNKLYVKDFSSGICTVGKIRSVIAGMDKMDLIVVDYLDELGGRNKRSDRWQEVEDSSRELKALASELNVPVWTATQTSSASYGKEFVGLQHIYGGKGKAHISHIVITAVQTEEERAGNRLRYIISKQKNGPKGGVVDCIVDLAKVRIHDAKLI